MSNRYKGAVISATPPTTSGGNEGVASGAWTLEQQMQLKAAGLWPNQPIFYIEDVFSTWLYTGNGTSQTITNGINLSGKGGLVWYKSRSSAVYNHGLFDTARGVNNQLFSNTTAAQATFSGVTAFNTNGFTVGSDAGGNASGTTYASWTFREQPKFFDVVTYTGDGASSRAISHNLGSTPGCVIIKKTNGVANWLVWHRSLGFSSPIRLNLTNATSSSSDYWSAASSTTFTLGFDTDVNGSGDTYVMYLFAHDAGGFGLTGTDNVISCGSYTGTGSAGNAITLGYEPQWLLVKNATTGAQNWEMFDNMRGLPTGGSSAELFPNTSGAERVAFNVFNVTATGFVTGTSALDETNASGDTYIYIAIRRGPMAVPTVGTSVFGLSARTGTGAIATVTGGQTDDAVIVKNRGSAVASLFSSRLTGTGYLVTSSNAAEVAAGATILQSNPWNVMDGVKVGTTSTITNSSGSTYINYLFKRAPSFFDVVCYVGAGSATTVTHNLGVTPELFIVKDRTSGGASARWAVYTATAGAGVYLNLNNTVALQTDTTTWNNTSPTASVFSVGADSMTNSSGNNFISYLFATLAGVSKVGSYTGTATTLQIDCGFTSGARFVLIKRTDSTGDWYVWDSARGIVSGNDPYLLLNSTAAEVTSTDYVDTYSAGFEISSTAPAAINASGGTFIFLAIA